LALIGFAPLIFGPKLGLIGFVLALNWVCFLISPNVHSPYLLIVKELSQIRKT
jgi:hypothetical protein